MDRGTRVIGSKARMSVAALAVSALAFTGISSAANGGDAPKIAKSSFTISGQSGNGTNANCPQGQHVLSGGDVQSGGPANLYQTSSTPLDNGKGWSLTMRNSDFQTNSQKVTVMAICSKRRPHMDLTRFFIDGGDAHGEIMSCDPGERAVGGGILPVDVSPARFVIKANGPLNSSGVALNTNDGDRPVKWFASMANGNADPRLVAEWVICLPHSKARIETQQFQLDQGETGEAVVGCGRKKTAIGGGVMPVGQTATMNVRASGPLSASPFVEDVRNGSKAKKWYGAAENYAGGAGRIFKIIAVCE